MTGVTFGIFLHFVGLRSQLENKWHHMLYEL